MSGLPLPCQRIAQYGVFAIPQGIPSASVVSVISDEINFPPRGSSAYNEVRLPNDRSLGKSHESTIATVLFLAGI